MLEDPQEAADGLGTSPHPGQNPKGEGTGKWVGRTDHSPPTIHEKLQFRFPRRQQGAEDLLIYGNRFSLP